MNTFILYIINYVILIKLSSLCVICRWNLCLRMKELRICNSTHAKNKHVNPIIIKVLYAIVCIIIIALFVGLSG